MTKGGGSEGSFSIDADSWTCPKCGETYRATGDHPWIRRDQRRKARDKHKCPKGTVKKK